MMDYEEMISALEGYFEGKDLKRGDALKIADAMKDLIAERNAAVEELRRECYTCKHMTNVKIVNRAEGIVNDPERINSLSAEDIGTLSAALGIARVVLLQGCVFGSAEKCQMEK